MKSNIQKLQSILKQSKSALLNAQHRTRKAILATGYWTGVLVIGFGITGIILHFSGIPLVNSAGAGAGRFIVLFLGNVLYFAFIVPVSIFAFLITLLLEIVIQYPYGLFWKDSTAGGFVNIGAVVKGWRLVRDICNMFFALILVIIALATVLKIEAYDWKRMLPKLILNAVLINFSKSIAGVFTDFATVAMATFGGSFTSTMGKALLSGFGMSNDLLGVVEVDEEQIEKTGAGTLFVAYVAAAIMLILFTIVALVFLVTLIFRIVMLWFLIVLSPLAYITRILPQTEKYSHQWWEMFGRYVVVGPLVTFFLWLSLTIAFDETQKASPFSGSNLDTQFGNTEEWTSRGVSKPPETLGTATQPNRLTSFMIGILMLMASLKLINQMAAEAGSITGKVQSAAMGAGLRLGEYIGSVFQNRPSKWGQGPPAEGEEDKRTWGQKFAHNAGNAVTLLGSTVLSPVTWSKKLAHNIEEKSTENREKARVDAMIRLGEMRMESIAGRGLIGGALGSLNNLGGVLGGAGMDDGGHIFEKYLSYEGAKRMYNRRKLWKKFGKEFEKVDSGRKDKEGKPIMISQFEKALEDAAKKEKDAKIRYTKEELEKDVPIFNELVEALRSLATDMNGLTAKHPGMEIHAKMPYIAAALQAQVDKLKNEEKSALELGDNPTATERKKQIAGLEDVIKKGQTKSLGYLLTTFSGSEGDDAFVGRLKSAFKDQQATLSNERKEIKGRLDATGVGKDKYMRNGTLNTGDLLNSDGTLKNDPALKLSKVVKNKKGEITWTERDAAEKRAKHVQHTNAHMLGELGAVEAGLSYEARKHKQKLVGEEMEKLRGFKNTDELMVYFNAAIDEKNHHMIEALLKKITENGDDNEIFQEWLSSYAHDPVVARTMAQTGFKPTSGRSGAELFRRAILQGKMGMGTSESLRLMNDISYTGEEGRHNGIGRMYGTVAGRWVVRSEAEQQASLTAENRKKKIQHVLQGNRLYWGDEVGPERKFQMTTSGWNELLSRGEAMGQQRVWDNLDANAKLNLSRPEIRREMRARHINPALITKLDQYWTTTGQYIESKDWERNMGIRKLAA